MYGLDTSLAVPTLPNPYLNQFPQARTFPPAPRIIFGDIPTTMPADDALAPAIRELPTDIKAILFRFYPHLFMTHQYWDGTTPSPCKYMQPLIPSHATNILISVFSWATVRLHFKYIFCILTTRSSLSTARPSHTCCLPQWQ